MAYIPKELAAWTPTASETRPDDGEQIVFHCTGWKENQWKVGEYCGKKDEVYVEIGRDVYEAYYWDFHIDYWLRVPSL